MRAERASIAIVYSMWRSSIVAASRAADRRGVRQLVILGAGLDTTAFDLPAWGERWRVFEVDHPATQEWKRQQIAQLDWNAPANLVYAPCDFETDGILGALDRAGFDRSQPAIVSLFGVILYLTLDATQATLAELASLAPGSEVTISYSPPPDGTDRVAAETFANATPTVDSTGESFIGHYRPHDLERLVRRAGFDNVTHDDIDALNARYLNGRPDRLRLHPIEQLITARHGRS